MQSSLCWKNTVCLEKCWGRGDNRIGVAMNGAIYHERQVSVMLSKENNCILHNFPLMNICSAFVYLFHTGEGIMCIACTE
jgi:hypothetical protein